MHRISEGFLDRGYLWWHVWWVQPGILRWYGDILGERARSVHADYGYIAANVSLTYTTLIADIAHYVGLSRDIISWSEGGHSFSKLNYFACEFVSKYHRRLNSASSPGVPVVDVQVGAADRGSLYLDEHFSSGDLGYVHHGHLSPWRCLSLDYGSHLLRHSCPLVAA